jgi:DNA-3-methyladenine glycosylase II
MSEAGRYAAAEAFLRGHDEDRAGLVDDVGPCRHDPKAAREPYEALVRAIAYQQLTAKAGDAMIDRLKDLAGSMFPTPTTIVSLDPGQLRTCDFSATKAATIQAIAQGALDGVVPTRAAASEMDDEALITQLISIKGVGRWTVEMLLLYSLERMDILPADDFGVRGLSRFEVTASTAEAGCVSGACSMLKPGRHIGPWRSGIFGAFPARATGHWPRSFLKCRLHSSNFTTRFGVRGGKIHT